MSRNVRDLIELYRAMLIALDQGQPRSECLALLETALRSIFPPNPAADRMLAGRCERCAATGWEIEEHHQARVGYRARIAVPCVCARGREVADSLGKAELAREEAKHAPRKPKGWVRA